MCGCNKYIEYKKYNQSIDKNNGKYYCLRCVNKNIEKRTKNSIKVMGENNHFYGKKHTKESKKKIKENHADISGEKNYWYGKHLPKETRIKISQANMGKFIGKNSPRWNPNLTQEEREIKRMTTENSEFIKKVLARDNYTCQCCGQEHGDLNAHHLDGYNWCKEKRTDETNGITLCNTCHKNFHSIYGYGNNTKEQFEKWIGHAIELVKYKGKLSTARKIYCIEEDKIYNSAEILAKEWNMKGVTQIYEVCNKKKKTHRSKRKDGSVYIHTYIQETIKGLHIEWYN